MKKFLFFFLLIILIVTGITIYFSFFSRKISPTYILPENTMLIAEFENPYITWNKFIKNPLWKYLKNNISLAAFDKNISQYDTLIQKNKFLARFLLSRSFTFSIVYENGKEKLLYIFDFKGLARLLKFDKIIKKLYLKDFNLKSESLNDYAFYEIYDNKGKLLTSAATIENLIVISEDNQLLKKIIKQLSKTSISVREDFNIVYDKLKNKGLLKLTINNFIFKKYLENNLVDKNIIDFINSFSFTSINVSLENDGSLFLNGIMNFRNDNDINTFYSNFKYIKGGKHNTLNIIPQKFSSFVLMGIENGNSFFDIIKQNNKEVEQSIKQLEKFLNIDIKKNFIDWIDDEICLLQTSPSNLGKNNELTIIIKASNINYAIKGLESIKKQVKKNTPLKFKELKYKDYTISYLHVPFLLKLLFGKFFEKLEKPFYTIIDNYVIFSNSPQTLVNLIDSYENEKSIVKDPRTREFLNNFPSKSLFLIYLKPMIFVYNLKNLLSNEKYRIITENKAYYKCFTDVGLSVTHNKKLIGIYMHFKFDSTYIDFKPEKYEIKNLDTVLEDNQYIYESTDISMTEEEAKFYEDENVHKEFYQNGNIKIYYKIKKGKKNGEYLEFYEDGTIKTKGKYKNDLMTGEWKFYNKNGELIEKKEYKEGIPIN